MRSAAPSPAASSPSSSLTYMRSAWNVRVAAWRAGDALASEDAGDEGRELGRAREGLLATPGEDGAGDAAGAALLAEVVEDVGKEGFLGLVDDIGGAGPVAVCSGHAHVEGPVGLEGEAARGVVESAWRRRRCRARCRRKERNWPRRAMRSRSPKRPSTRVRRPG